MTRPVLGVACLAALLSASPAAFAGDALAGCAASSPRPGEMRYECSAFSGGISVEQPEAATETILEMTEKAMEEGAPLQLERTTLRVDGVERPALAHDPAQGGEALRVVVVPSATDGRVRSVVCQASTATGCDERALAALAHAARQPIATPPPTEGPRLAGQALTVPDGCTYAVEGSKNLFRCPSASVSWVEIGGGAPAGLDVYADATRSGLEQMGTVSEATVDCAVAGVASSCRRLSVTKSDGQTMTVTIAVAEVRGQRVLAQCNAASSELPEACEQVVSLED